MNSLLNYAPLRHKMFVPSEGIGHWDKKLQETVQKLGTGFLVGLVGLRGNGKTQLGVEVMKQAAKQMKSVCYITATDFFLLIKETYKQNCDQSEREVIAEFRKPSLLVLDEMGKRGASEWENRLLFHLINCRYNALKDTLLISNQSEKEFTESMGPSLISRMNETGGLILADWETFRK